MTDELIKAVSLICELSPQINQAADDATNVVRAVETLLSESSVGIPIAILYDEETKDNIEDEHGNRIIYKKSSYLAYGRYEKGKYRILVSSETAEDFDEYRHDVSFVINQVPWLEATREDRLESFNSLPKLLISLAEKSKKLIDQVEITGGTVTNMLAAMGLKDTTSP